MLTWQVCVFPGVKLITLLVLTFGVEVELRVRRFPLIPRPVNRSKMPAPCLVSDCVLSPSDVKQSVAIFSPDSV